MLGDTCIKCHQPSHSCGCSVSVPPCDEIPQPCIPCDTGECVDPVPMHCVIWMGDPIPGTPIKKGMRLTEVVTYLLSRIDALS